MQGDVVLRPAQMVTLVGIIVAGPPFLLIVTLLYSFTRALWSSTMEAARGSPTCSAT